MIDSKTMQTLKAVVRRLLPKIRDIRHCLHAMPEPALRERETQAFISETLRRASSLKIRKPLLETDVIADMDSGGSKTIGFRADIDGLPIQEKNEIPHRSATPGAMHACGHDGHTAILLGAALALDRLKERPPVNVRFIFQPGEEVACAGRDLVERGACDGLDSVFALHGQPGLPAGMISTRSGALYAAGGFFQLTVRGKGCHGAMPQAGVNPIPPAARLIADIETLHHEENRKDGSVISVCSVHAGNGSNIIPESVTIKGTLRYLEQNRRLELERGIKALAREVDARDSVNTETLFEHKYSQPVVNSEAGYRRVREAAELLDAGGFREAAAPTMGNEDFAFYLEGREGAMFWLGLGEDSPPLHSPRFDFNDSALAQGVLMFCLLALGAAD